MNERADSTSLDRFTVTRVGIYLYGLATMAAGILDFIWGEFEGAHQPIGALGDNIPGLTILAYTTAIWLIAGGAAILWPRTARLGALATAIIYFVFGMFWLPRFYTAPQILGFRLGVITGLFGQMFMQLILVAGGLLLYAYFAPLGSSWPQKSLAIARWTFGLGSVFFGLGHLTSVESATPMIPGWMPFSPSFWVILSGIAFVLAGLAILSGIMNALAARLLALMLLIFEVILVPVIFAHPSGHIAWGSTAYNLAAAGAVWIFADSIASRHTQREHDLKSQLAEVS